MTGRFRIEEDSLGRVSIPSDAYYGVQTERARQNFAVSGQTLGGQPSLVEAIVQVKKAAALANLDVGVLREPVAEAICQAADEVHAGLLGPEQFPVDVLSGGGGASLNANVNEVLGNRANELLCGRRGSEFAHPQHHVNAGQSTSDSIATAVNIALHWEIQRLLEAVEHLAEVLEEKVLEYGTAVRLSRTGLPDAVPITFGQTFGSYLAVTRRGIDRLRTAADSCLDVPMGGTMVGTGLGAGAGYLERIYPRLRETTGLELRQHPNFFDALQNGDGFQYASTVFKALACGLTKMAKDLRTLADGDRVGTGISLPVVQAGSSFLPRRVDPVMAELVVQVGFQVCGNDTVVTMAVQGAELDFNAWSTVIAKNLFESARLLIQAMPLFADKCLLGLEIDTEHNRRAAEQSLGLSRVIGDVYGYDVAAQAARHAAGRGLSVKDAVIELGIAPAGTAERLLDPAALADSTRSSALLDGLVAERRAGTAELVRGLSPEARLAIFYTTGAVALADSEISQQEEQALAAVGDVLGLAGLAPVSEVGLPADLSTLDRSERELVYACAAWLASADSVTDAAEADLLSRLRAALNLDGETADLLRARVDTLRSERRRYLSRAEQPPWWEEFGELLHRLRDKALRAG
ncbi:lyase family protein [Amycolatopsis nigrescens]|uniref:lyase family protein n=1 Tax=Amycolatopsis nigrescens TaxID=381445 RepID=UPI00036C4041|nr:lyase family protein [Amycolatopsis nigrescens]